MSCLFYDKYEINRACIWCSLREWLYHLRRRKCRRLTRLDRFLLTCAASQSVYIYTYTFTNWARRRIMDFYKCRALRYDLIWCTIRIGRLFNLVYKPKLNWKILLLQFVVIIVHDPVARLGDKAPVGHFLSVLTLWLRKMWQLCDDSKFLCHVVVLVLLSWSV